jgi:hypothetical protein
MSQSGLFIEGGFAPIMGVETIGTVSPSFMGAAANGWVGWVAVSPVFSVERDRADCGLTFRGLATRVRPLHFYM